MVPGRPGRMQSLFTTGGVSDHKESSFLSAEGIYWGFVGPVCIPPTSSHSDRNSALCELYQAIREQQTAPPDGFTIITGDFNHADLKTVLPILDLVLTSHKGAYKTSHIGLSDHITVMLMQE